MSKTMTEERRVRVFQQSVSSRTHWNVVWALAQRFELNPHFWAKARTTFKSAITGNMSSLLTIEPHRESWRNGFEQEAARIQGALGAALKGSGGEP
jgi:hypothetical protein